MAWGDKLLEDLRRRGRLVPSSPAPAKRRAVKRAQPPVLALEPAIIPWTFTLIGAPRTKGSSRSGFGLLPSQSYRRWFHAAMQQLPIVRATCRGTISQRVRVDAVFYRPRRGPGDLDNYFKGLGDWLEKSGLLVNDRLITSWGESRVDVDRERPRIEITITPSET